MSEQLVQPLNRAENGEGWTRRRLLQHAAARYALAKVGLLAAGGAIGTREVAMPYITREYEKYSSLGGPFNNYWDFLNTLGAVQIDRARLDELLDDRQDDARVYIGKVAREEQSSHEAIGEYDIVPGHDGPVYLDFDGLYGNDISLTILRAVVDDKEEFLIPLIRDNIDQPPVNVQLGHLAPEAHKLQLFVEHSSLPVDASELSFRASQGVPGTLRSFIDAHQPDLYLRNYSDLANNFPRRSYAAVYELPGGNVAVVYTTETIDEDQKFGLGTSLKRLDETEGRPTDGDWGIAAVISDDGRIVKAVISEPYHNMQPIPISRGGQYERTQVRFASENNNLERITDESLPDQAKVRFRPVIGTHAEIKALLRSTDQSSARLSMCENYFEGKVDSGDEYHAYMLGKYGLDLNRCRD